MPGLSSEPRRGDMFIACAAATTKAPSGAACLYFPTFNSPLDHEVASDSHGVHASPEGPLAGRTSDEPCSASEFRISCGIAILQPRRGDIFVVRARHQHPSSRGAAYFVEPLYFST